jgi:hypothetical protein
MRSVRSVAGQNRPGLFALDRSEPWPDEFEDYDRFRSARFEAPVRPTTGSEVGSPYRSDTDNRQKSQQHLGFSFT